MADSSPWFVSLDEWMILQTLDRMSSWSGDRKRLKELKQTLILSERVEAQRSKVMSSIELGIFI